jgi:hypothetical protein
LPCAPSPSSRLAGAVSPTPCNADVRSLPCMEPPATTSDGCCWPSTRLSQVTHELFAQGREVSR